MRHNPLCVIIPQSSIRRTMPVAFIYISPVCLNRDVSICKSWRIMQMRRIFAGTLPFRQTFRRKGRPRPCRRTPFARAAYPPAAGRASKSGGAACPCALQKSRQKRRRRVWGAYSATPSGAYAARVFSAKFFRHPRRFLTSAAQTYIIDTAHLSVQKNTRTRFIRYDQKIHRLL